MNTQADIYTIISSIIAILLFVSETLGWSRCHANSISQFFVELIKKKPKKEEEEAVVITDERSLIDILAEINPDELKN